MDRLKALAPWQIALIAVGILAVVMVGAYAALTLTLKSPPGKAGEATVPTDLDGSHNKEVLEKLQRFKQPKELPQAAPLRTPDPNNPNTNVNPFR